MQEIKMFANKFDRIALVCVCGCAMGALGEEPGVLESSGVKAVDAGRIYYNVATGERLLTLVGDGVGEGVRAGDGDQLGVGRREARSADWPGWDFSVRDMCAPYNNETLVFPLSNVDEPELMNDGLLDSGDIAPDTVIDMVEVSWATDILDVDLVDVDGNPGADGIGDGVEGLVGEWTFWDACDGRQYFDCVALPIVSFRLTDLPGKLDPDSEELAEYRVLVDLGFQTPGARAFEIGDTDSDLQGAVYHNPNLDEQFSTLPGVSDLDLDEDGLADWGWSVRFMQPGTIDSDNADGDDDEMTGVDGDPLNQGVVAVPFAVGNPGHLEYDEVVDIWEWVPDFETARGGEDVIRVLMYEDGELVSSDGPYFFGGLRCGDVYQPMASFAMVMYGPYWRPCGVQCPMDINVQEGSPCPGDGVLNFLDISEFLRLYSAGDMCVDFAGNPDGSPDGFLNFLDVSTFLSMFAAGCP